MKRIELLAEKVLMELVGDNVLGCRSLLSVCRIHFSRSVDSAAVTLGEHPRLLINPDFLAENAPEPADIRVVILHEFLHVLLRHHQQFRRMTPLLNFVLDIQVNSLLGRQFPHETLGLLHRLYGDATGPFRLLAPPDAASRQRLNEDLADMHRSVYGSWMKYSWAALIELFKPLFPPYLDWAPFYLGNHADQIPDNAHPTPAQIARIEASTEALQSQSLSGHCLFSKSPEPLPRRVAGVVDDAFQRLRGSLLGAPKERPGYRALLPVLHPGDRRAAVRASASPILPFCAHPSPERQALIRVYLDVSGSMSGELPAIIGVLHRYRERIEPPLRAFSTRVAPATWNPTGLAYDGTGGTDLACVINDLKAHPAAGALLVTDGHFSAIPGPLPCPMHAILSRHSSAKSLDHMNIPSTPLP